jgi:hypothetical protein
MKTKITVIAQVQLDAAIDHYFKGGLACAITLAGAAEELLGGLCKRSGIESALDQAVKIKEFPSISPIKERKETLNSIKNALKHSDRSDQDYVEIVEEEAYILIARAIYNLDALKLEHSQNVFKFCSKYLPDNQ